MNKKLLILLFIFLSLSVSSQVQVRPANDNSYTPIDLINNVFLGEGLEILDIKYEGKSKSVGYFYNGDNAVKINRGIIMTTGEAAVAPLPNNSTSTQSTSSGKDYTDDDLSNAIGNTDLYDIARYEISFIPFSDSISFKYSFASEEYPEFSCNKYNDAFGFFITGLNPNGVNYDRQNIALVPGTSDAVSIKNVHPKYESSCLAKNGQYYRTNPSGSTTMTYDGYLKAFIAAAKVVPCTEYKIKIAITDVSDDFYDSAVFLEAKSFSTDVLKVSVETSSFDGTIAEGCSDANIRFYFNNIVSEEKDLEIKLLNNSSLGNIALEGLDFSNLPTQNSIKVGQNSYNLNISAFEDNLIEDEEVIVIQYRKDLCNLDTLYVKIVDNKLTTIEMQDSIVLCEGDEVNVGAKLPDDYVPPKDKYFSNNNDFTILSSEGSETISSITVNNVYPDILKMEMIKEICIDTLLTRSMSDLDIYLISPDDVSFELSTDNGFKINSSIDVDSMINTCFTPTASKNINNGNPIKGDYFLLNPKFTGQFSPEGVWSDLWGTQVNGEWKLQVINDEIGWTGLLSAWHIAFNSNYGINYNWIPNSNISCIDCISPDISPPNDRIYTLNLTDSYGCSSSDSIKAIVDLAEKVPFINCDSISTDFIRFVWGMNNSDEKYEVRINNSGSWIEVNENFFNITGLGFSEIVNFEVRVLSTDCINLPINTQCQTYPCPPPSIALVEKKNIDCFGDNTGIIDVDAFGTKGPYTYKYKGVSNNNGYFDNLPAGIDTIFITDDEGCEIPYVFEILSPEIIQADYDIDNISCFGDNDGSILANAYGGNGDFIYNWTNKLTSQNYSGSFINNLVPGMYYVTITDDKSCSKIDSIPIWEPDLLQIGDSLVNVECKGYNSGKIFINPIGGTKNYSYNWETPLGISTNKDLINMPAGKYFLTVTDANGCEEMKAYVIDEPAEGLIVDYSVKDSVCFGNSDGSIVLNLPSSSNYTINWSNGSNGDSLNNLGAGIYKVTISDELGCERIIEEEIIELESLNLELDQISASCHDYLDGQAWVNKVFYGGRETDKNDFTFVWNSVPPQTGNVAYDLKGGSIYTVTGVNKVGCTIQKNIAIGNPEALIIKAKTIQDISCFGFNDGSIELTQSGGNDSFEYKWSANANTGDSPKAINLRSGIYKVTVVDEKGCQIQKTFNIKEPKPIIVQFDKMDVNCFKGDDGEAKAIIEGGIKPYILSWGDNSTDNKLSGAKAGVYEFKVIDFNGCEKIDSIEINEPIDSVSSSLETKDVSCNNGFDGEIIFITEGGSPPYSHKILNGDFYGGNKIIGLNHGKYSTVTKDVKGCTDTIYDVLIDEPDPILVDLGQDTTVDYGNVVSIKSNVSNANSPLIYKWIIPDGIDNTCDNCPNTDVTVLYNLLLKLKITDNLGCLGEGNKNIYIDLDNGIYVPNAFKPESGQAANRKLHVYGKSGIKVNSFVVYNNWGGEVYKNKDFMVNDESVGWDGTFKGQILNPGVFAWYMEIENIDGTIQNYKGVVTLLR